MRRCAYLLVVLMGSVTVAGCGDSKPSTPATDPETIKKLEEQQRRGGQGEKGKK